jgi:hypothetical protein
MGRLSLAVTAAVAEREGTDRTELPEPLFTAIDTDALDGLFNGSSGRVVFGYLGYEVTVTSSGDVRLDETVPR